MNIGVGAWLFAHPIIPYFCSAFDVFSFMLHTRLGLRGLVFGLIYCICGPPLDPTRTHLFRCSHGWEWITSHNAIRDVFASIMRNARFHVSCEQINVLLPPSVQFPWGWVDIMLSIDGTCIWVDMVIADPIQANLVSHVISSCVTGWSQWVWLIHKKDYTMIDTNTCISNFFHRCVDMACWAKGTKALVYRF